MPKTSKSKNKRYSFTWREEDGGDGKRYEVRAENDIEAGKEIEKKKEKLRNSNKVLNKNTTVKQWSERWLEVHKKGVLGQTEYQRLGYMIKNHIVEHIGSMRVCDVKLTDLQGVLNLQMGYSESQANKVRIAIKSMFRAAYDEKLCADDPAARLKMVKAKKTIGHRALTLTERKAVLALAETHKYGLWIKFIYHCGLRPQETAGLQWHDIDMEKRRVRVERALERVTKNLKEPKSKAGERFVPIPPPLYETLTNIKRGDPFEFVFTQTTTGRMHSPTSLRGMWRVFKHDLNVSLGCRTFRNELVPPYPVADDLVPYCLRHNYCTMLQEMGVPINLAREYMGHADIKTTQRIYTHDTEASFNAGAQIIKSYYTTPKRIKARKGRRLKLITGGKE